ncbi:hypothetical protein [Ruminococcus sp.]|uniref:hypothetical protein n=1 Tax=Ruminococcus sp. TaxID=41978 RepID=UPI003AB52628
MKFKKTLASVCAAAIAVSSLAVSAFAAPLADKLKNDNWVNPRSYSVKSADITSDDLSAVNKVVFNMNVYDINYGWNNGAVIVKTDATKDNWIQKTFGGTESDKQESKDVVFEKTGAFEVPVEFTPGPNGAFELMVTGVADNAFAVESIALYSDAELVGTYGADGYVKASTPEQPKPVQTKADISFTDGKTPSYTYTVKGDIDTLKVDVALSADAAAAGSGWNDYCSAGVAVKNPDGTVKYYQWGGASIAWAWDVNGDGVGDTKDGVGTETWVGTVGADGGQLSIPVVKGAVVDFYCLSWDKYKGVQYTFTINDEEAAVKPVEPVDPVDPVDPPVDPGKTEDPAEPVAPADVKIANSGRTVIDSGLVRTNIINEWTGNDADVIADKAAFAGANKISVKFTVTNFTTPFKAWIAMADSKWECQFQGEGDKRNANAKCTPVEVTGNGTYVVTIDLDKVIDGVAFISVCTDLKAADGDAIPTIAIDQIKINEEITVKPGESDPVKPGDCSGEPVNPPTGAAVAVIPAALAAAAVATTGIVLKKRSK